MEQQQKDVKKQLESISVGDLICVEWCDASTGNTSGSECVDVPVKSWGIFIGVMGRRARYIVLAQNSFWYADGFFDLDYTSIPLASSNEVAVVVKDLVPKETSKSLVNSFLEGRARQLAHPRMSQRGTFQRRLSVDGRPD